ncbi:Maltase 1 [Bulinus truncatus]|nr:Maltase 1 [Bulinus truncatus]
MSTNNVMTFPYVLKSRTLYMASDSDVSVTFDSPENMEWWKKSIVYQIYPRSFQDSNGDGIGDIPGIMSRLDHFTACGVGAIWISPFYKSPQFDFGYDIEDFVSVDPMFGTLKDFDQLVQEAHRRDIKIIIDFVPGHTSHLHRWFQKSVRREDPYTDYYVWHDGKSDENGQRIPPNNWISVFGGSAWTWSEERQQFYYRPFLPQQPKLNYRCPHVVQEMKNVLKFWLQNGADGIRVDALSQIMEVEDKSLDEPRNLEADYPPDQYEYLNHIYTSMLPEGFPLVKGWRTVLDEFTAMDGISRFMVIEVYEEGGQVYRQYGGVPFNMNLVDTLEKLGLSGINIKRLVGEEYDNLPPGDWPTFVLGNHDRHRFTSKYGPVYADALNMLLLTLKGTPTTYYGEEIGMEDIQVSYEETQDPFGKNMGPDRYQFYSRDPCRSPMQWDASPNAGFSTNRKTWLPVHPNHTECNVKTQSEESGQLSTLKIYKLLARLRQSPVFLCGEVVFAACTEELFSYVRQRPGYPDRFLVVMNVGKKPVTDMDLTLDPVNAKTGSVLVSTGRVEDKLSIGQIVHLVTLSLNPGDGLVLRLLE